MKIACFHDYEKGIRVDVYTDESKQLPTGYTGFITNTSLDPFDYIASGKFHAVQAALEFATKFLSKFAP